MNSRPDLVIVGAGLAGLGLAAALADTALQVRVLSQQPPLPAPAPAEPLRLRVSTLNAGVIRALQRLGVWPLVPQQRLGRLHAMRVWEERDEVRYDSAAIGEPLLGQVAENDTLVAALAARCVAAPNIRIDYNAAVTGVEQGAGNSGAAVMLLLKDGQRLSCRLLVGADGGASSVRALAGIDVWQAEYRQRAVVANVTTRLPNRHEALQRFLPEGPLALLPLPQGASALVWSTSPDRAAQLEAMDERAFCAVLQEASAGCLGAVLSVGPRASFPLRQVAANRYIAQRVALIGDAAHVVHPLAGLGANLALADAFALAQLLAARPADPGSTVLLRRYERWRRSENDPVAGVIHGLDRLFRHPNRLVGLTRRRGLTLVNRLPGARTFFMARACGNVGDLPDLMRPL